MAIYIDTYRGRRWRGSQIRSAAWLTATVGALRSVPISRSRTGSIRVASAGAGLSAALLMGFSAGVNGWVAADGVARPAAALAAQGATGLPVASSAATGAAANSVQAVSGASVAGSSEPGLVAAPMVSNPDRTVVLTAGDTLWVLATRHYPNLATSEVIAELRQANGLADAETPRVGQRVILPELQRLE